ncbi:MAG: glutathione S-transferase [Hyphomicrobiales bacterium]|nr:glutathione S-transferase [Hyphomicrobiales bacterium]MDE2018356.1 glutathione S-transferase [Hyphomicrobiales bacterium]
MILRSSPPSPFGRKVKIALSVLGLSDRVSIEVADTSNPADSLRGQNPLGKIPTLILDDGTTLYDSRVIVEYLDWLAGGGKILPPPGPARFAVLRAQALADGIMDASILRIYETRFREEARREPKWLDHQAGKVDRGLAQLEATAMSYASGATPDLGEIALACALGYLDLRFSGEWRAAHPRLVAWLDGFAAATPAFEATRVKG